jgi:hypothetical protein
MQFLLKEIELLEKAGLDRVNHSNDYQVVLTVNSLKFGIKELNNVIKNLKETDSKASKPGTGGRPAARARRPGKNRTRNSDPGKNRALARTGHGNYQNQTRYLFDQVPGGGT